MMANPSPRSSPTLAIRIFVKWIQFGQQFILLRLIHWIVFYPLDNAKRPLNEKVLLVQSAMVQHPIPGLGRGGKVVILLALHTMIPGYVPAVWTSFQSAMVSLFPPSRAREGLGEKDLSNVVVRNPRATKLSIARLVKPQLNQVRLNIQSDLRV